MVTAILAVSGCIVGGYVGFRASDHAAQQERDAQEAAMQRLKTEIASLKAELDWRIAQSLEASARYAKLADDYVKMAEQADVPSELARALSTHIPTPPKGDPKARWAQLQADVAVAAASGNTVGITAYFRVQTSEGGYIVEGPNGTVTQGDTLLEAAKNLVEALKLLEGE